MSSDSFTLTAALSLIAASRKAYRALLQNHPMDWGEEAIRQQQEAADMLDRAHALGRTLNDPAEQRRFADRFSSAYAAIERSETLRAQGGPTPGATGRATR